MFLYHFIWVLALLGLTNAAGRDSGSPRQRSGMYRLESPRQVQPGTRTNALRPRNSQGTGGTYQIAMQSITFSRKRAIELYYLTVENGVPKATDDPTKASDFLIPDGAVSKDLQWVPSLDEASAQGVSAGEPVSLMADAAGSNGIYNLRFAKPDSGPSIKSFFQIPPFARGFSPVLDSGSSHPHVFLWSMDTDGKISFVQDAATMRSASINAQAMVAQAITRNEAPSTADALAALQQQLVIPGKLFVMSPNSTISGYVSVSTDDQSLIVGTEEATFFAPGLTTGHMAHTLTTKVNGETGKVFQADSSLSGSSNTTQLAFTTEATTDAVKFVLPSAGTGIVKVAGYGIGNWELYVADGKLYSCRSAADCYEKYGAQPVCAELVPPGTAPSTCATLFANGVPTVLLPIVPPGKNTTIEGLDPTKDGNLTFSQNGTTDATLQHLFAVVEANYTYPTVVLPEISAVSDVDCAPNGLYIKFNDTRAFNFAVDHWTPYNNGTGFLLITDTLACSTADVGQHGYWLVNSMTFDNSTRIIFVDADEIGVSDAFNNIHVIWGTYVPIDAKPTPDVIVNGTTLLGPETANSTVNMYTQYTSLTCVNPPASYRGLPTAACGPDFDLQLDAKLGYIDINDISAMNSFAPFMGDQIDLAKAIGEATGEPLSAKRDLHARHVEKRGWFSNLVNKAKQVVNQVANVANEIARRARELAERVAAEARALAQRIAQQAREIAERAARAAAEAAAALKRAAEAALRAKVELKTPVANIPIAVRPGGFFANAFGTDKALVIWETSVERALGGDSSTKSSVETESKVSADIGLYCVDCGVTGNTQLQGSLEYTLLPPVLKTVGIDLNGNLLAQVNLGLIAEASYSHTITKELWSQPIPGAGIKIGQFLTVGVAVTVSAEAEFEISAQGEVVAGMAAKWDDFNVHVNLINPRDNRQSGFTPKFEHKFEAAGEISAKLGLGLPVQLGVGVNIPPLQFNKQIGVVNTPKVEAEVKYKTSGEAEDKCGIQGGLGWAVTAMDEVSLDILGNEIALATLAEFEIAAGCIKANPGAPAVSVPVSYIPPTPAPVYPKSDCGLTSTGRMPWAVYDNIDFDGHAITWVKASTREQCDAICTQYPTCNSATYYAPNRDCAIVDQIYSYKPTAGFFVASIRGETCESNKPNVPAHLLAQSGCCTVYREK